MINQFKISHYKIHQEVPEDFIVVMEKLFHKYAPEKLRFKGVRPEYFMCFAFVMFRLFSTNVSLKRSFLPFMETLQDILFSKIFSFLIIRCEDQFGSILKQYEWIQIYRFSVKMEDTQSRNILCKSGNAECHRLLLCAKI